MFYYAIYTKSRGSQTAWQNPPKIFIFSRLKAHFASTLDTIPLTHVFRLTAKLCLNQITCIQKFTICLLKYRCFIN